MCEGNPSVLFCFELHVSVLWCLLQLALHLPQASEIHPADICGFSLFISTAVKFHCLNTLCHILCIQFPVEGRLGHFQLWFFVLFCFAITNNVTKKILHLVFWCTWQGYVGSGVGLQGCRACLCYIFTQDSSKVVVPFSSQLISWRRVFWGATVELRKGSSKVLTT